MSFSLAKDRQAIREYFKNSLNIGKRAVTAFDALLSYVDTMDEDEKIAYALFCGHFEINPQKVDKTEIAYVYIVITNKYFYYAGTTGLMSFVHRPHGGKIDIRDIHAISSVQSYLKDFTDIKFEVKNDDYQFSVPSEKASITKNVLEEAMRASKEPRATTIIQQTSSADELLKFKQLLDSGIITQEEFNAKKKQLLGL